MVKEHTGDSKPNDIFSASPTCTLVLQLLISRQRMLLYVCSHRYLEMHIFLGLLISSHTFCGRTCLKCWL